MIYIYTLADKNDIVRYVGQTNDLKRRYNDHISYSFNENSNSYHTYKSRWIRKEINSGGEIIMSIIDECHNLDSSNFNEDFYITYLTSLGVKLTNSHNNDVTEFSVETRKKMSDFRIGKSLEEIFGEEKGKEIKLKFGKRASIYWKGKEKSESQKNKISETLKEYFKDKTNHWAYEKEFTTEHKEKMRLSHLNNPKNIGNTRPKTEEQKNKIREKVKGSKVDRLTIVQKDLDGNILAEWKSLREIEKSTGLSRNQIAKCCKSENKIYAGYHWSYGDYAHKVYCYDKSGNLFNEYKSVYNISIDNIVYSEFYKYLDKNMSYLGYYWYSVKLS